MKTVLCFGDSNTYGTPPMSGPDDWGRHDPPVRWPGVLRQDLGEGWHVVEEGLPGRTTLHDDPIEGAHKNGLKALPSILESHRPIDVLVVMLGTNDLKARFAVTPEDIAASVGVLIRTIQASPAGVDGKPPALLLVSPAAIVETGFLAGMFRGGAEKSRQLGRLYSGIAERLGVAFLDAEALIRVDPAEGIHLDADQHRILGRAVAERVRMLG